MKSQTLIFEAYKTGALDLPAGSTGEGSSRSGAFDRKLPTLLHEPPTALDSVSTDGNSLYGHAAVTTRGAPPSALLGYRGILAKTMPTSALKLCGRTESSLRDTAQLPTPISSVTYLGQGLKLDTEKQIIVLTANNEFQVSGPHSRKPGCRDMTFPNHRPMRNALRAPGRSTFDG